MAKSSSATKIWNAMKTAVVGPEKGARLAKMLNVADTSREALLARVKDNPMLVALMAYEIYGVADPMVQDLFKDDSIRQFVSDLTFSADKWDPETEITNSGKYDDELEMISRAARMVGSLDRLMAIRSAIAIDDGVYFHYVRTKEKGRDLY